MTDRLHLIVVVEIEDMDGSDATINAIRHIRGVVSVDRHVPGLETRLIEARARRELAAKISALLRSTT